MKFDPSTIPARMSKLDRDRRGYPVPFIVWRDTDGRPHFTINDTEVVMAVITGKRCSICGGELGQNLWCIGGPLSAFHEKGCYIDPPVHKDCGTFALKTCPYIAAPNYSRRIDSKTVDEDKMGGTVMFLDRTMIPERPAFYVMAKATGYTFDGQYLHPRRPWQRVEFWREGVQISDGEARSLALEAGINPDDLPYWPK